MTTPIRLAWILAVAGIFGISCGNGGSQNKPDASPDGAGPSADAVSESKDANLVLDAAKDTGTPADSARGCTVGDRTYDVGQSVPDECHTCICQADGHVACTPVNSCPPKDASPRDTSPPDASTSDASPRDTSTSDASTLDALAECRIRTTLTFGSEGGNALFHDINLIDTTGVLTINRIMSGRGGDDGGSTSCSQALPACGTAGAVSAATLTADLADADVKAGFAADTTPFYGVDQRPVDGPAYAITQSDGHNGHTIMVGAACSASSGSACRAIPAGVQRLVNDLKTAYSTVLAAPVCKGL